MWPHHRRMAVADRTRGVICLLFSGTACASASSTPLASTSLASPPQPGDALEVRFSREPEQSGIYPIDEIGDVPLPFLGRRTVLDLSPAELRSTLLQQYEAQLPNQTVYVRVLRRVRVLGAVSQPGVYHVDATVTLADVIARAGGVSEDGHLTQVRLRRGDSEIRTDIHVAATTIPTLQSGDQVFVPRKSWLARNSGSLLASLIAFAGLVLAAGAF